MQRKIFYDLKKEKKEGEIDTLNINLREYIEADSHLYIDSYRLTDKTFKDFDKLQSIVYEKYYKYLPEFFEVYYCNYYKEFCFKFTENKNTFIFFLTEEELKGEINE